MLISIILPTYNSEKYIKNCLDSVINQSYNNWELIIVDDCSTDLTKDIILNYSILDKRIKLLFNEVNIGAGLSRNRAISSSIGDFICFIDSDDIWFNNKLKKQLEFMISTDAPISFHSYSLINESGDPLNKIIKAPQFIDYNKYLRNTIIGFSTSMLNVKHVKEIRFSERRIRQDTQLWLKLLKNGFCAYGINESLSFYRLRNDSISANKFAAAIKVWELYYREERLGLFKSVVNFGFYAFNAILKRI